MDATRPFRIDLVPMIQRAEIKTRAEDWTGKSSTSERRKLQNRLNQRAARRRKAQGQSRSSGCPTHKSRGIGQTGILGAHSNSKVGESQYLLELINRPHDTAPGICMSQYARNMVASALNFDTFLPTTLPVDQQLLTLLHFNLVRAFGQLLHILGYTIDDMSMEPMSPFSASGGSLIPNLPSTLQPTAIQRSMVHYAELDVFPYSEYRDNCILAGDEIDDVELCNDILYGVESERKEEGPTLDMGGRIGLIVWNDPWRRDSWEVDEKFARKYSRLFKGCQGLIESSNTWRASRGEPPLPLFF